VVHALWMLSRTAVRSWRLGIVAVAAVIASAMGAPELEVLLFGGAVLAFVQLLARRSRDELGPAGGLLPLVGPTAAGAGVAAIPFGLWPLFLVFLKVGAVLFGSGYVLLAFLRTDLVERLHWLTEAQLLEAVAVGQVTPGPVFTTATFIGYILGGTPAALTATAGIFLPAFVYVAASGPLLPHLRRSPAAGAALDGVIVASLGLMATVTWQLGQSALVDPLTTCLAALSAFLLLRYKPNSAWLVGVGALIGLMASSWTTISQ
jgi:chromate transporter